MILQLLRVLRFEEFSESLEFASQKIKIKNKSKEAIFLHFLLNVNLLAYFIMLQISSVNRRIEFRILIMIAHLIRMDCKTQLLQPLMRY
jgi:hypothetical protein